MCMARCAMVLANEVLRGGPAGADQRLSLFPVVSSFSSIWVLRAVAFLACGDHIEWKTTRIMPFQANRDFSQICSGYARRACLGRATVVANLTESTAEKSGVCAATGAPDHGGRGGLFISHVERQVCWLGLRSCRLQRRTGALPQYRLGFVFKALPGNFIWTSAAKSKRSSRLRRPSKKPLR